MLLYQYKQLLDNKIKNMNVDGSSSIKIYQYSPDYSLVLLNSLRILLKSTGESTFEKFGTNNPLINGLVIKIISNKITTTICEIKDNADLINVFSEGQYCLDNFFIFKGKITFPDGIKLSNSDIIQVLIQDDLSDIDTLEMGIVIGFDNQ